LGLEVSEVPLYEYECAACGRFELIQKFSDAPLTACPTCGREVHKLLSAPAIQFKGTGWYITDYARKSGGPDGKSSTSKDGGKDSSSKDSSSKDAGSSATSSTKDSSTSGSGSTPSSK
jgi:putative FmdB family regulatory protein